MIDFVKIVVEGFDGSVLKKSPLLSFYGVNNEDTGEYSKSSIAIYKGLKFIVFKKGTTYIQGSLHKYINEGQHNYDDFTYSRLEDSISQLENLFGINPRRCKLQNLEVGLNIEPCINTQDLLDNIVLHKCEEFKHISLHNGNYRQVIHSSYYLKAYDKALQYDLSNNMFRWEVKMKRGEIIRKNGGGVTNLHDLLDKRILKTLLNKLIQTWEETLVLDPTIKIDELTVSDVNKAYTWRFKDYWLRLRMNNSGAKRHYYTKELKEYKSIVKNHSNNIQDNITFILKEKVKYCLNN